MLLVGSFAFRAPPLLNASATNSDAAVVGLQAIHVLRGELSPFLWGSGYQTSADSIVAAGFFALLGSTPLALMLSSLCLHVLATCLVFSVVRRVLAPGAALLVTLPLVVSPSSVHSYALYPPRQASLTLAIVAFFAIDRASRSTRARHWLFVAGLFATLAVSADPYPLVLLPVIAIFALLVSGGDARRWTSTALGALVGLVPFLALHRLAGSKGGPLGLTTSAVAHHWKLLVNECLPWALSYKVYFAHHVMDYLPWDAPLAFGVVGALGAALLGGMVVLALLAVFTRSLPWPARRLGFVGASAFPIAIAGFLASVMVMDHFSMRYLAVLTLMTPFAVTTTARALGTKRFAIAFAPHLIASAVAGWVGYGPFVRGPWPITDSEDARGDRAVLDALRTRGIRYAMADYWASYRLTFVSREEVVVVPTNAGEDRYAPYRRAFAAAPVFAYIFDPGRSRETLETAERTVRSESAHVERVSAGDRTILVVTRASRGL